MIRVEQLSKSYRRRSVLRNLNLEAAAGTCTVLLGANGAGKTTLLRILAGLTEPDTGRVVVNGFDLKTHAQQARQQLGLFSHQTLLYNDLSAVQNLRFYCRLYQVQYPESRIETLLQQAGLAGRSNEPVRNLSHGCQQRLALLRAILHNPAVLLLDEPARGLDEQALTFLNNMLQEALESRKTILLTTHQPAGLHCPVHHVLRLSAGALQERPLFEGFGPAGAEKIADQERGRYD
ncbi:MAG: heme ABC exporter ATP-binding protein CcmA [Anaerolineales bacterium]|nr:heme ABC exporter ATP-binding protein CcmA [Anaerolineales bacterium]